jgi:hypothetical protein
VQLLIVTPHGQKYDVMHNPSLSLDDELDRHEEILYVNEIVDQYLTGVDSSQINQIIVLSLRYQSYYPDRKSNSQNPESSVYRRP